MPYGAAASALFFVLGLKVKVGHGNDEEHEEHDQSIHGWMKRWAGENTKI